MSNFRMIGRNGRLRLLATCSVAALACAVALPAQAAPLLTGNAIYSLDGGSPTGDPQSSSTGFDIFPSDFSANSSIFGHDYGIYGGAFGTRGSGTGVFNIDSFSRYQDTITNDSGVAGHYYFTFTISGGEIGANMSTSLTGQTFGGVSANILVNGSNAFTSSASMSVTDGGLASFTTAGVMLNPGGGLLDTGSGSYSWRDYSGVLDLGVLAPGASVAIDYHLTSLAFSTVAGCTSGGGEGGYGGVAAFSVVGDGGSGYGGSTSCYDQSAVARIGDPPGINVNNLPPSFQTSVPEPGTMALLGAGLAGLAFMRRRRSA